MTEAHYAYVIMTLQRREAKAEAECPPIAA